MSDFMEAYDTQMELIRPNMRHIWLQEQQKDQRKFDQRFIKVHNLEELRRLLARELYGTKPHLSRSDWEVPFLQAFLD